MKRRIGILQLETPGQLVRRDLKPLSAPERARAQGNVQTPHYSTGIHYRGDSVAKIFVVLPLINKLPVSEV
jgi:hypothetical protein